MTAISHDYISSNKNHILFPPINGIRIWLYYALKVTKPLKGIVFNKGIANCD